MGKYLFEIVVLSSVLLILYAVLRVAYVVWWRPNYLEKVLRRQGIRGTSYKFLRGDMAEIRRSTLEAQSKPMSLNHHIMPRVFPFFYDVMQKYGTQNFDQYQNFSFSFQYFQFGAFSACFHILILIKTISNKNKERIYTKQQNLIRILWFKSQL